MARRRKAAKTPPRSPAGDGDWVCVGVITRPKGIRGAVRIAAFTERPGDVAAYGPPRAGIAGEPLEITVLEVTKGDGVVAEIAGIADRDSAEALRGTRLYLPRAALPEPAEDEFYRVDLVGLRAERADGTAFGTVRAVHDYGAGDVLEVAPAEGGETVLLPFTRAVVPMVDIAGGRLVIEPPEVVYAGPGEGAE